MKGLPARTGLEWLKQGFALFRRQPGIFTTLVFANLIISILLLFVPLVGPILFIASTPVLNMAIQQACHLIDSGQPVTPAVLLTGVQKGALGPLFRLGLIYFGVVLVLLLMVAHWVNLDPVIQAIKANNSKVVPVIDRNTELAMLAFIVMHGVAMLALSFAPALTHWKRMPTFKAIFYSVFAVIGSLRAVLTMMVAAYVIFWVIGKLFALLLGNSALMFVVLLWLNLILSLVIQCAIFAAYKQLIGAPGNA
jgi:hypothetical protein